MKKRLDDRSERVRFGSEFLNFFSDRHASTHADRAYDVVLCLFSSIGYVKTKSNLNRAVKCMANHLTPGGILLIEPSNPLLKCITS